MTAVLTLLFRRARALGTTIRNREGTKVAVIGLFALLFGAVMVGEYLMFRRALVEVLSIGPASIGLTLYILESFLILVLVLSVVSFVATGLWTFYRAFDTAFLLSTPLPLCNLFWLRAAETFFLTSWASVVLGIPALLALGAAYRLGASFYLLALAVLILFMVLAGGLGTLLTVLAGAAFRRHHPRTATLLALLVLVGGFALLVGRHVVPATGDFYLIFEPGLPNGKPASLKFIESRFGLWPSHPFAVALFAGVTGTTGGLKTRLVAVAVLPALALAGAGAIGRRLFALAIPAAVEGGGTPRPPWSRAEVPGASFPRFLSGPIGALVERDLRGLARNPHELGRAGFMLFLLVLYSAILFVAPLAEVLENPEAVARLLSLDLMAVGYFVTAFGIRFVFPSLSLEGRGAWILFASPVSLFRLFLARFLGYSALLALVVGPVALGGALRLATFPALLALFGLFLGLLIVTTVSVALGFGVLWPNFRETNAETLATNAGGLATTILCLGYVAAVSWIGHRAAPALLRGEMLLPYLGEAGALSAGIVAGVVAAARRRISSLEIL